MKLSIRNLGLALLTSACALAPALAQSGPMEAAAADVARHPDPAQQFDEALAAYDRNHWSQAFSALARLGDRGHAQAARMALQMRRYGPQLFGTPFEASSGQVEHWSRVWACGSESAHASCRLALQAR